MDFVPSKVQHSIERLLSSGSKTQLKNKVELLEINDENLFAKEFSDHLTESVKSKRSSKEVFLKFDDSKNPFRSGPSFQQQQRKSGGQKQIATDNRVNQSKQTWSWNRKNTNFHNDGWRFQSESVTNSVVSRHISSNFKWTAGKRPSINKMLVFKEMLTKVVDIPPARRISHFLVNWQKSTLNQDILSVVKGYRIPFIKISFQQKFPNFIKMNKK